MKDEKKHQIHQMFDILVKTQYTKLTNEGLQLTIVFISVQSS